MHIYTFMLLSDIRMNETQSLPSKSSHLRKKKEIVCKFSFYKLNNFFTRFKLCYSFHNFITVTSLLTSLRHRMAWGSGHSTKFQVKLPGLSINSLDVRIAAQLQMGTSKQKESEAGRRALSFIKEGPAVEWIIWRLENLSVNKHTSGGTMSQQWARVLHVLHY
jgi:hypothetical protein